MDLKDAVAPVAALADRHVVITTMGSVGAWPRDAQDPLVLHYMPSSMGQGPSLALGVAMAQPERRVVVLNGDGCMLMNLGVLATIGQCRPTNLSVVVIDNGIYEVTGGQPHGGANAVDFAGVARACGFQNVFDVTDLQVWESDAEKMLTGIGPVFVCLHVAPRFGCSTPKAPRTMSDQIKRLQTSLGVATERE